MTNQQSISPKGYRCWLLLVLFVICTYSYGHMIAIIVIFLVIFCQSSGLYDEILNVIWPGKQTGGAVHTVLWCDSKLCLLQPDTTIVVLVIRETTFETTPKFQAPKFQAQFHIWWSCGTSTTNPKRETSYRLWSHGG